MTRIAVVQYLDGLGVTSWTGSHFQQHSLHLLFLQVPLQFNQDRQHFEDSLRLGKSSGHKRLEFSSSSFSSKCLAFWKIATVVGSVSIFVNVHVIHRKQPMPSAVGLTITRPLTVSGG